MKRSNVIVVQPAVPSYRLDFFARLAEALGPRFVVYASPTDMGALTEHELPPWQRSLGSISHPLPGLEWQAKALSIPVRRGDILVIAGTVRSLSTLLLIILARLRGATTVWWGQYWSATGRVWRLGLKLVLLRLCHALLFYTDEEIELFAGHYDVLAFRRVSALNNGTDVNAVKLLRKSYRASERPERIFFVGRLTDKSHLDLLLEAMTDARLGSAKLAIVGSGANEASLRAKADELKLGDRVKWYKGTADEKSIAAVANSCRLFVYPGSVGLSLIHAMSYGLPAVVHNDRWRHYPEIAAFADGQTGRSFKPGDVTSLADAVAALLYDTANLDRASRCAIATVETRFNTVHMTERMLALIDALEPADEGSSGRT